MTKIEAGSFGRLNNISIEPQGRVGSGNSGTQEFISIHKEMAAMMREQPMDMNLAAMPIWDSGTLDTGLHETMHGLMSPGEVIAMSVVPDGPVLGWTLTKNTDDSVAAAGIVHGRGYGSDKAKIQIGALLSGRDPNQAVDSAVSSAKGRLGEYRDYFIPLVAKGVTAMGTIDGNTFRGIMAEADWELSFKDRWGFFPPNKSEFDKLLEAENALSESENPLSYIIAALKDDEQYTLTADLDSQETVIIKLTGKNIVDIQVKCTVCGMPGGHLPGCSAEQSDKNSDESDYSPSQGALDFVDKVDKYLHPDQNFGHESTNNYEPNTTDQLDAGKPDSNPVESEPASQLETSVPGSELVKTGQPDQETPIFEPEFADQDGNPDDKKREVILYPPPQPDEYGSFRTIYISNN